MTPALRRAIEFLSYVSERFTDTTDDAIAQRARHHARNLLDEYGSPHPSEAEAKLRSIREILR